jgi:hypothetical protein
VVQAARWLKQHPDLKGQALANAAKQQKWDASVQALVALPDVLNRMDQDVGWTSDLGNAVLAQQADVMAAIQRMREKASANGALQSTPQQTVSTQTENGNNYIVIQPSSTEVISVPQYNPAAVYGPPPAYYPYPAMYYPPYTPGAYVAASAISFGVGMAVGAFWGGGGWGWGCGWGHNDININNNFIRNNNFNRASVGSGNRWQHNPNFRGGVPYNNRGVANRYQGRGGQVATRPNVAQVQQRLGQGGVANRTQGNFGQRGNVGQGGPGQRGNLGQAGAGRGSANRVAGGNLGGANRFGGDRIGNRSVSGGAGQGAFGGINQGGARALSSSNRGHSSLGGGGFRGGGGGGFRGGGGGGFRGGGGGGFRGGGGGRRR